ncbi:hypothetical protein ACR3K2_15860 [Cryptosporidium serpentis]
MEWISKLRDILKYKDNENKLSTNSDSIEPFFQQSYEMKGCYRCNLCTKGLNLGNYICDLFLMEDKLLVFHIINRTNMNIPCVLAPVAATAFAISYSGGECSNLFKGEWFVLPLSHIVDTEIIDSNTIDIQTKTGLIYHITNNDECIRKIVDIWNQLLDEKNRNKKSGFSLSEITVLEAPVPIANLNSELCSSLISFPSLLHVFPCCIVSLSPLNLLNILSHELFYGKYILDPQTTYELIVGKWDKLDENNTAKSGSCRNVEYKKKLNSGFVTVWISFLEKHEVWLGEDFKDAILSINVKFSLFERNIEIKIFQRVTGIESDKSQLDIECELANASALPYFLLYQVEAPTINNIKLTVKNYRDGIQEELSAKVFGNHSINKQIEFGVDKSPLCDIGVNRTCCLNQIYKSFNSLLSFAN